jgi:hypothetical protein
MPRIFLLITWLIISSHYLVAQNEFLNNHESIEVPAKFRNGNANDFRLYIESIVQFSELYEDEEVFGRIVVEFRIDTLGNLTDIKILRGVRKDFDDVVINALIQSPKWTPAKINNKPVSQRFAVPFYDNPEFKEQYERFKK